MARERRCPKGTIPRHNTARRNGPELSARADVAAAHLQPLFDPRRGLIALANRANIDQVVVDGRVLIDAGHYVHGDEAAIISAAAAAIGKIWDLSEAQAAFNG